MKLTKLIWGCMWASYLADTFSAGVTGDYPVMFAAAIKSALTAYMLQKI